MLENETDEDIVSHLYMSEAYYFNPKCLKRHQVSKSLIHDFLLKVKRLVNKLKSQIHNYNEGGPSRSPERVSIHGNSPSPVRH